MKVLNVIDAHKSKYFNNEHDKKTGYRTRSVLCVPICAPGDKHKCLGVLQLLNKNEGKESFTQLDETLMNDLMHHVAGSIQNIERDVSAQHKLRALEKQMELMQESFNEDRNRLKAAEESMRSKSSQLLEMSKSIVSKNDIKQVFADVMKDAHELLEADRASLFLYDDKTSELYTIISEGTEPIRIPKTVGLIGACFTSSEVLNIEDAYEDHRFSSGHDKKTGYKTKTVLCHPIYNENSNTSAIGAIQIINKKNGQPFTSEDVSLLKGH